MTKMMVTVACFAAIGLADVSAQYRIAGNVRDENDKNIAGTTVSVNTIGGVDTVLLKGTNTDTQGNYELRDIPAGEYAVRYEMPGLSAEQRRVSLSADTVLDTVRMFYDSGLLDEVVVKGRLLNLYGAKETRLFTEAERGRAVSGLELMKNLPQIALNNTNNRLTTLAGKSILILRDGIQIDETDLMALPPSEIVRAEYYSHPPAKYLNAGADAVLVVTTRRSQETGGYLVANLTNSFTTGYGTNTVSGKHSFGENDLSFRYFVDYRDLNKNRQEQSYSGLLDGKRHEVNKQGLNSDYRGAYHIFEGAYSRVRDDLFFNAKAKMVLNPGIEESNQDVVMNIEGETPTNFTSNLYTKSRTLSPSLDLYLSKKMRAGQELSFNVVNTFLGATSDRNLSQAAPTFTSDRSYSLIGEATYTKEFKNHALSAGVRNMFKTFHETFNATPSKFRTNNLYYYVGLSGSANSFSYSVDMGGEHTMMETSEKRNFFVPKSSLYLSWKVRASQFSLYSALRTSTPEMSILSDNPFWLDAMMVSRGNSRLRPYSTFANQLQYTLNRPSFYFQTSAAYFLIRNPYRLAFTVGDDAFQKTYTQTHNNEHALKYTVQTNWKPFKWLTIRPYGAVEYQSHKFGGKEYRNWYKYVSLYLSAAYRSFSLDAQAAVQNRSLEGTLLSKPYDYYTGMLTWQKDRLSLTMGVIFSHFPSRSETYRGGAVSYAESKRWNDFQGLTYIRCTYRLPWGKNIERTARQRLSNSDTDSGMSSDNRAKQ